MQMGTASAYAKAPADKTARQARPAIVNKDGVTVNAQH
jgi:hypothetical protein